MLTPKQGVMLSEAKHLLLTLSITADSSSD